MIKLFLVTAFCFMHVTSPVWVNNLADAKDAAKKEHKFILLNFSGSDWCIPCMRLHQEIFEADAFKDFADGHLILLSADFPRKKSNQLSKEQQKMNDRLAEKYNPEGSFPFTLLLDSDGNKIKVWD